MCMHRSKTSAACGCMVRGVLLATVTSGETDSFFDSEFDADAHPSRCSSGKDAPIDGQGRMWVAVTLDTSRSSQDPAEVNQCAIALVYRLRSKVHLFVTASRVHVPRRDSGAMEAALALCGPATSAPEVQEGSTVRRQRCRDVVHTRCMASKVVIKASDLLVVRLLRLVVWFEEVRKCWVR